MNRLLRPWLVAVALVVAGITQALAGQSLGAMTVEPDEGFPGDSFTIEAGNKWPGTYEILPNGEIITGDPLQYTEANYKEHAY